jgi:hypothetical protein
MPIQRLEADQYRWIRIHDDSSPLYEASSRALPVQASRSRMS